MYNVKKWPNILHKSCGFLRFLDTFGHFSTFCMKVLKKKKCTEGNLLRTTESFSQI